MRRCVLATFLFLVWTGPLGVGAERAYAETAETRFSGPQLIQKLRGGGLVVLIRHTSTGPTPRVEPVLGDCSTQRVLTDEGRREARELGRAFRKMGIGVGDIITSPWCRCIQTAEAAFGKLTLHRPSDVLALWDELPESGEQPQLEALRAMLATPPRSAGANTVLISHSVNLQSLGLEVEPEGLAHVFEPGGAGYLGSIQPDAWRIVAGLEADRPQGRALVNKLAAGGYVLLMRHAATVRSVDAAPASEDADEDLEACGNQRVLSDEGRRQAEGVAQAVERLGIQAGDVWVSPVCRCVDTGRIAFGKATVNEFLSVWDTLPTQEKVERSARLRELLNTPPEPGTITVLITHSGALIWSLGLATEPEGIAHVFEASDLGRAIHVGQIRPQEWRSAFQSQGP